MEPMWRRVLVLLLPLAITAACQRSAPQRPAEAVGDKVVIWRHLPLLNENIGYIAERGSEGWTVRREGAGGKVGPRRLSSPEAADLERMLRDQQVYRAPAPNDQACQDGAATTVSIRFEGRRREAELRCEASGPMGRVVEAVSAAVDGRP